MSATVEELLELPVYRDIEILCTSVGVSIYVLFFTFI